MLIVNYDVFTVQLCSVRKRDIHETSVNFGTGFSSVTLSPVEQLCQLSRGCLPETQLYKLETKNPQACVVILFLTLQSLNLPFLIRKDKHGLNLRLRERSVH